MECEFRKNLTVHIPKAHSRVFYTNIQTHWYWSLSPENQYFQHGCTGFI